MKTIRDFLQDQLDRHLTPSIQYAYFDTDHIISSFSFGAKEVKTGCPVEPSTNYHLYSVTKTFTALAVLQLVQEGRIALTQEVAQYLPGFPYDQQITVEQLLSHTSGIPNPLPLRWIHTPEEHVSFDWRRYFDSVMAQHSKLDFKPGTQFQYSNLGYVLLGNLIEKISGQLYEEYIVQHVIMPCGIDSSDLSFQIQPDTYAVGYHRWWSLSNALFGLLIDKPKFMGPREGRWKPFRPFYINGAPYGGLIGSMTGLIIYAQTLLKDDSILLQDSFKQILFSEKNALGKPTGMSYSWFTGKLHEHSYIAHAGGGGGYYVELRLYPERKIGSVILYNRSGMKDERILSAADHFFLSDKINPLRSVRQAKLSR